MKKFKVNNEVHEIEEGFEHLLPMGSVEITAEEAAALLAPTTEEQTAIDEAQRVKDINIETVTRITTEVPAIESLAMIDFAVELFKSVDNVTLTPSLAKANAIRVAGRDAVDDGITQVGDIVWPI